jgi:hypothetical protein
MSNNRMSICKASKGRLTGKYNKKNFPSGDREAAMKKLAKRRTECRLLM